MAATIYQRPHTQGRLALRVLQEFLVYGRCPARVRGFHVCCVAIIHRYRMWEAIARDIDFLKEAPSPARALSAEEETRLLDSAAWRKLSAVGDLSRVKFERSGHKIGHSFSCAKSRKRLTH